MITLKKDNNKDNRKIIIITVAKIHSQYPS